MWRDTELCGIIDDFITLVVLESAPGYEEVVEVTKQNYIGVMLGLDQDETDNYLANSDLDNIWDLMSGDVCKMDLKY